jgi:hypothetical protein
MMNSSCFDLVIEVLLISSIEVLVVSSQQEAGEQGRRFVKFQSRNRGSFDFKSAPSEVLRYVLSVVAIPRATHFGTRGDSRNISRIASKHGS